MADRALAQHLQPLLKTSGPAPMLPYIEAAILVARDSLSTRAACRAVEDVPESVNSRVGKLAGRVRVLLAQLDLPAAPLPPPPQVGQPQAEQPQAEQAQAEQAQAEQPQAEQPQAELESAGWGLPPLEATREPPNPLPLPPSPPPLPPSPLLASSPPTSPLPPALPSPPSPSRSLASPPPASPLPPPPESPPPPASSRPYRPPLALPRPLPLHRSIQPHHLPCSRKPSPPPPGSERALALAEFSDLFYGRKLSQLNRENHRDLTMRMLSPPGPRRILELARLRFVPEADWAATIFHDRFSSEAALRDYVKEPQQMAHRRAGIELADLLAGHRLGYCGWCGASDWRCCSCPELEHARRAVDAAERVAMGQVAMHQHAFTHTHA